MLKRDKPDVWATFQMFLGHWVCFFINWQFILFTLICMFLKGFSLVAQRLKRLPPMLETWVRSPGQEDTLEKEMATHSSILACRSPWTEEPGRLQSMGSQRVGHDWATSLTLIINIDGQLFSVYWPLNLLFYELFHIIYLIFLLNFLAVWRAFLYSINADPVVQLFALKLMAFLAKNLSSFLVKYSYISFFWRGGVLAYKVLWAIKYKHP